MHPEFLYFDLGKVLVDFDIQRMLRQIGEVSGVEPARVKQAVFDSGLQHQSLHRAGNEIFELNLSLLPVVAHLTQAGYRLGILSNTCEGHWQHCRQRFRIVAEPFSVYALSCQIGVTKPEAAIFHKAAELAGVRPQGIFYVDDLPQHVASARAVGFDAVQYTSTPQLVADLRTRGIRLNY
jgi:HAD superfamily hydrolase (TIGR01509 family)